MSVKDLCEGEKNVSKTGIVENIDGSWGWVKTRRKSACAQCRHEDCVLVKARNAVDAKNGNEVELFISTKTKMKCVFMV